MKLLKSSFFISAILFAMTVQAQTVDEILANYFENTGGLENWEKMESMKSIGKVPSPQGDFPFVIYAKKPNKMKLEIDIQGKVIIPQAYDGEIAWSFNPLQGGTVAQKMPEEQVKEMADQAEFEPPYFNYKEKGHEIIQEGEEEIDGVLCFKIKLVKNKNNDKEERTEYYFFDKENFVPIMQRSMVQTGPAKGMESETYLSDYQETNGGVIMPYYIEARVNGQVVQKIVIDSIMINFPIADSIFTFPETSSVEKEEENK